MSNVEKACNNGLSDRDVSHAGKVAAAITHELADGVHDTEGPRGVGIEFGR